MYDKRGTGRTARMMDAATAAVERGVRVLVLAADSRHAEMLRKYWPKVAVQTAESAPVGMDCVLWEDHYAREAYEMLRGDSIRKAARIEGARAALEAAAERAMTEEELDGPPPPEIAKDFRNVERAVVHLRAAVKSTKSGIAEGIRDLSPESVVEGMKP